MSREFIFVYGTLRKKHAASAYHVLARYCDFFGEGTLSGELFEVEGYPGVVESNKVGARVTGELYVINDPNNVFSALDEYEECTERFPQPHEYVRKRLPIHLADGGVVKAWTYVYNRPTDSLEKIESGDYIDYVGRR